MFGMIRVRLSTRLLPGLALAVCSMVALVSSPSKASAQTLQPGALVSLRSKAICYDTGCENRWLDGRTVSGTVGVAPNTDYPYTGTKFLVVDLGNGAIGLWCMGDLPGNRWLDGNTINGTVGLAPKAVYPYTGTKWAVHEMGGGVIKLETLGYAPGPRFLQYLGNGGVGLTSYSSSYDTNWEVYYRQ